MPLALAFAARREQVLVLGVGEGRGGSGRGGEGRGGLGCGGSPQLSLLNVPGGPRTITIDLLQFPYALVSQTSKGPPVWRVTAGCMRDILYETDYTFISRETLQECCNALYMHATSSILPQNMVTFLS